MGKTRCVPIPPQSTSKIYSTYPFPMGWSCRSYYAKTTQTLKVVHLSFQGKANLFLPSLLPGNVDVMSMPRNYLGGGKRAIFQCLISSLGPSGNFPVRKDLRISPFSSTGTFLFFPVTLPFPGSPPIYYISKQAPKSLDEPEISHFHGPCHPEPCMQSQAHRL